MTAYPNVVFDTLMFLQAFPKKALAHHIVVYSRHILMSLCQSTYSLNLQLYRQVAFAKVSDEGRLCGSHCTSQFVP